MGLVWNVVDAQRGISRAKVPGGWLIACEACTVGGGFETVSVSFYPDPYHEWDGSSLP